jgi:hypothetical protein
MQQSQNELTGGWLSQAYLTYNVGNTMIKAGRQELPKSLSPMAFSEDWNVFKNTYDAIVAINTDIKDTTLVAAYVNRNNSNPWDMGTFADLNGGDGALMLTAQNKSIENVTLTGSYYHLKNFVDVAVADVATNVAGADVAGQFFNFDSDVTGVTSSIWGVRAGKTINDIAFGAAYSSGKDGAYAHNIGGTTSAVYTSTPLNQLIGGLVDEDKWLVSASTAAMNGQFTAMYSVSDSENGSYGGGYAWGQTSELDVVYATKLADVDVVAAYVHAANDEGGLGSDEAANLVRVTATYNF